jgi:hypothetical protein
MRKISLWAKNHKWQARVSIVVIFLLLNALGIFIGSLLHQLNIILPIAFLYVTVSFFLALFLIYPQKHAKRKTLNRKRTYALQKACDFFLAVSTLLLVCFFSNRPEKFVFNTSVAATTIKHPSTLKDSTKTYKTIRAFATSMKDKDGKMLQWKERKKLLKEQIRGIKKAKDVSDGNQVLLTILSVIVALGLIYLVAALACSLSCSGSDAAAVIVGIGGLALVILLLVVALRAIHGKKKKPKP